MSTPPGSLPAGSYDPSPASLDDYSTDATPTDAAPALLSYTASVAELRTWWVSEVSSPKILPFQTHAVASLRHHLDEFTAILDAESAAANFSPLQEARVLDLDRSAYVYKSYLRVRLGKIHDSIMTISGDTALARELRLRLSPAERTFAARYFHGVVQKRLQSALLGDLPERWARLDEAKDEPNLNHVVFIRARSGLSLAGSIELAPGEVAALPFSVVEPTIGEDVFDLLELSVTDSE